MEIAEIFNYMLLTIAVLLLVINWTYRVMVLRVSKRFGIRLSGRTCGLLTFNVFITFTVVLMMLITSAVVLARN